MIKCNAYYCSLLTLFFICCCDGAALWTFLRNTYEATTPASLIAATNKFLVIITLFICMWRNQAPLITPRPPLSATAPQFRQ